MKKVFYYERLRLMNFIYLIIFGAIAMGIVKVFFPDKKDDGGFLLKVAGILFVCYCLFLFLKGWFGMTSPGAFLEKGGEYKTEVYVNASYNSSSTIFKAPARVFATHDTAYDDNDRERSFRIYLLKDMTINRKIVRFGEDALLSVGENVTISDQSGTPWKIKLTGERVKD